MDVLFLTCSDWCNTGYRMVECLKMLGLNVIAYKGGKHMFKYPEQLPLHKELIPPPKGKLVAYPITIPNPTWIPAMRRAHVIHFHASVFVDTGMDLSGKFVVVQHGGGTLRLEPKKVNRVFNPIAHTTIIHTPDLLGLGCKNEKWLSLPVDTDFIRPDIPLKDKKRLVIGHFPSTDGSKGTRKVILPIIKALEESEKYRRGFIYIGIPKREYRVPWLKTLKNMRDCDVIIDGIQLITSGKSYGEWMNQALEAAALGKIVITHSLRRAWYKKRFGMECPFLIANNATELKSTIKWVILADRNTLVQLKKKTRAWVVKQHSMKVYAKRLWDEVYSNFFIKDRNGKIRRKHND